jgi:hypothetical protein
METKTWMILIIGAFAAALLGVLVDWLLKPKLTTQPKISHIISGMVACMVLAIFVAYSMAIISPPPLPPVITFIPPDMILPTVEVRVITVSVPEREKPQPSNTAIVIRQPTQTPKVGVVTTTPMILQPTETRTVATPSGVSVKSNWVSNVSFVQIVVQMEKSA